MFRDVELLKAHELGEVKIGLGPYAAVVLLPDLLVEFSRRFPKIKVLIELSEGDELMQKLRTERVDFVVTDRRVPPVAPDLALHRLPRHEGGWFARPDHPLLASGPVPLSALREFPLVSVSLPGFMKDALHRLLKYQRTRKFRCRSSAMMLLCSKRSWPERTRCCSRRPRQSGVTWRPSVSRALRLPICRN